MPFTVYAGPDPDACLRELLCRTPLRVGPLTAVVPDSRSVEAFERMLAGVLGNAFAGHRVYTMEGLARAVIACGGPVPETVEPPVKRALAAEIVRHRFGEHSAYGALSAYQGFVELFSSWLADVRSGDADMPGDRELRSAAEAYENRLGRLGATDHEGWMLGALEGDLPERFATAMPGVFIVHGFSDLTERQGTLIGRIVETARRSAATIPYDATRPELFAVPGALLDRYRAFGAEVVEVFLNSVSGVRAVERRFRGAGATAVYMSGDVAVHTFRSVTSEADWVAGTVRSLVESGDFAPGDIMIASRVRQGFGSPLAAALARNGIPVEGGIPIPLDRHPVVRFILAAVEASMHPFDERLIRVVRTSSFAGPGHGGGRDFDDRAWNCMVEVGSPDDFTSSVRTMLDILGVEGRLDGCGDPLKAASERAAYARFLELLDMFAGFYTPIRGMMQAAEFNRLFRLFLRDASVPDAPATGRGVLVADANTARHAVRPVVFLTGLDIASFPGRRGSYSLHEPRVARMMREHAQKEDPLLFLMAFHGASKAYFTFPGIDNEGGDSAMSPYLREIVTYSGGKIEPVFHRAVPGAAWEGGSGNRRGGAERLVRMLREDPGRAQKFLDAASHIDARLTEETRQAVLRTVAGADERGYRIESGLDDLRREWDDHRAFTVSELEDYAVCPIKFLFSRLFGLDIEMKFPGEINPAERGMIVHDILARFHRAVMERGGIDNAFSDRDAMKRLMGDICERVFSEHADVFTGLHRVAASSERRFLRGWMEAYLEREEAYAAGEPFRPAYCEVGFGRHVRDGAEEHPPLSVGHDGETVLVQGRIDRIDIAPGRRSPLVRVIDYKIGGYTASGADLAAGFDLQIPLYLKAAVESIMPGAEVHDGMFYGLREMELKGYRIDRKPLTGDGWQEFINVACTAAVASARGIRAGLFPSAGCGKNDRCGFLSICRGGRGRDTMENGDADS